MDSSTFDSHKVCEAIWADTCSAAAATGLLLWSSVELRETLAAAAADVSSAVPFLIPSPVCAAAVGGQSQRCVLNPSSLPPPSCTCWISSISWQYMVKNTNEGWVGGCIIIITFNKTRGRMQRGESYSLTFFSLWVIRGDDDDALTHPATGKRMDVPYLPAKKDRWSSWLRSLISGPSKLAEKEKRKERERERRRLTAMGCLAASPHHESFHKRNSGFNPKVWARNNNQDRSTSTTHKKEIVNYLHQRIKVFPSSSSSPLSDRTKPHNKEEQKKSQKKKPLLLLPRTREEEFLAKSIIELKKKKKQSRSTRKSKQCGRRKRGGKRGRWVIGSCWNCVILREEDRRRRSSCQSWEELLFVWLIDCVGFLLPILLLQKLGLWVCVMRPK